jgi:arylsulfatase A-like enzyme
LRGGNDEPIASRHRGDPVLGLPPAHPTLASLLRDAGYATALAGKWHMGFLPHFGPLKSGYQAFFGPMSGGVDYFTHKDSSGVHDLYDGETEANRTGYLTDLISDRAVEFIGRRTGSSDPFLLSVHYTAPHWPWETRADEAEARRIEKIFHFDGGSVATYRTMIRPYGRGHRPHSLRTEEDRRGREHARRLHQRQRWRALFRYLAARREEDGPAGGRHSRAVHRALACSRQTRWRDRATRAHDGLDRDFSRCRGVAPQREHPLDGVSLLRAARKPDRLSSAIFSGG